MSILTSINPATNKTIWEGPTADAAAVNEAVARARAAFDGWQRTPLAARIALVEKYKAVLEARKDALTQAISDETGKPRPACATWNAYFALPKKD